MIDQLPAPPTPANSDLRRFPYMELEVARLRDSRIAAHPDAEVFRAAVLAWCAAFHQVPAASRPDDNAAIAHLIGMGRDVDGMARLREAGALQGFTKCNDGRLYHSFVAEKALRALSARASQRERTQRARVKAVARSEAEQGNGDVTVTEHLSNGDAAVTSLSNRREVNGIEGNGHNKKRAQMAGDVFDSQLKTAAPSMPGWVPTGPWEAYADMRKKIRKPMTNRAVQLTVMKLSKLRTAGQDIAACLDQSTRSGWPDIYPIKIEGNRSVTAANSSFGATLARVVDARAEPGFAFEGGEGVSFFADRAGPAIGGREGTRLRLAHQEG